MTSAAEKYGKIPESLSSEGLQKALDAGTKLHQNEVRQSADLGTPARADATPPKQSQDDEQNRRGLTR